MSTLTAKLPKPPSSDVQHISESQHITRERSFTPSNSIAHIVEALREAHATGQLTIDMNQGGIGSIRFIEKQKLKFENK